MGSKKSDQSAYQLSRALRRGIVQSPGQGKELAELAGPTRRVVASEKMKFTVPVAKTP
jgi:hypothetical protein